MSQPLRASRPVLKWSKDGKRYQYILTDPDRVWFARAIWREGSPTVAVGYTLVQRFVALHPKYETFSRFLRAYCQPINPQWYLTGQKHKRRMKTLRKRKDAKAIAVEIERARRRERYSNTGYDEIPQNYRALAERLLTGLPGNPVPTGYHFSMSLAQPGASHAQAMDAAQRYADRKQLGKPLPVPGGYGRGNNWFFEPKTGRPPRVFYGKQTAPVPTAVAGTDTGGATAATAIAVGLIALRNKKR